MATPTIGVVSTQGGLLLGVFEVNPLHNIIHLIVGAALLIAGLVSVMAAKVTNATIGAIYAILGIVGFFIVNTQYNYLALNTSDHFLHIATAIVLLVVALTADKTAPQAATTPATAARPRSQTSDTD